MCTARILSRQTLACEQSRYPAAVTCQSENYKWYTTELKPTYRVLRVKVNSKLRLHPTSWSQIARSKCPLHYIMPACTLHNEIERPKKGTRLELTPISLCAVLIHWFHSFVLKVSGPALKKGWRLREAQWLVPLFLTWIWNQLGNEGDGRWKLSYNFNNVDFGERGICLGASKPQNETDTSTCHRRAGPS